MPDLKRPIRKAYLPEKTDHSRTVDNSRIYKSVKWTKLSLSIRKNQRICPIEKAFSGFPIQIIENRNGVCDHIIRIEDGGAPFDTRNLMGISKKWHDRKSGLEAHNGVLVPFVYNDNGYKIPRRREDVIDFMVEKYTNDNK